MSSSKLKRYGVILAMVCSTALVLSLIWKVPYLYTAIGFAAWAFAGHLITIDDDLPGGWNNPDGSMPFPWAELAIKAAVLHGLLALVFLFLSFKRSVLDEKQLNICSRRFLPFVTVCAFSTLMNCYAELNGRLWPEMKSSA